jgi:hypothetical protein
MPMTFSTTDRPAQADRRVHGGARVHAGAIARVHAFH